MRLIAILAALALPGVTSDALADPAAGEKKANEVCVSCHGPAGNSTQPQYPVLAGQTFRYAYLQLRDFNEGRRKDPQMSPMAANLTKQEMMDLAEYYAKQKPRPTGFKADPARVERGRKKSEETLCTMCHLGGFMGQNEVPRVAGQWPEYVVKQLKDFRTGGRTNDAGTMSSVAKTLSDEDMVDLSHFLGNL